MAEKILAAMSGGVDSSAAALLLMEQGYDVAGGTMLFYRTSPTEDSIQSAKDVCEALGIGHYLYDFREMFKEEVINRFVDAYLKGDIPNPCVECNKRVKFGKFIEAAEKDGFEKISTGHYAIKEYDAASGRWLLKKGADALKDQSYFLYGLSQEELARTEFPLGGLTKAEIKEIVRARGLAVASRKESQDVCFLPEGDYRRFIVEEYGIKGVPGDFIGLDGAVLGRHNGVVGYTRGQRRGLGVSADSRLYVVDKDVAKNTVTLGRESDLYQNTVRVSNLNFIAISGISGTITAEVKLRYSRSSAPARITMESEDTAVLEFSAPQRAPTRGQSAVFYDGDTVIGGGTIM